MYCLKRITARGTLFLKHPELSGQNWLLFQLEFIKSFFNRRFLTEYIFFRLSGEINKDISQGRFLRRYANSI